MSNPSDPRRDNIADESGVVDGDAATEIFAPAEPTEMFAPAEPTEVFAPAEEPEERRFTAPSAFDSSTQIIGQAPHDPETEIIDLPGSAEAEARAAGPQTIPARENAPEDTADRRRSWGWVVALLLVIAALVAVAILITVLLTRGPSQSERVRAAIQTYDTAVQQGDLSTLRSITCGNYDDFDDQQWHELHARVVENKTYPVVSSIDEVMVNGDRAEANVTAYMASDPSHTSTRSFDLRRDGDQWKICEPTG